MSIANVKKCEKMFDAPNSIVYSPPMPEPEPPKQHQKSVNRDVLELVDAGVVAGLGERETLLYHYTSLIKLMGDRLANCKSVNLGFIILHSTPYRIGWERHMLKHHDNSHYYDSEMKFPFAPDSAKVTDAQRERLSMVRSILFAMNRKRSYIYYRVAVEHTGQWCKMSRTVEMAKFAALGSQKYAELFIENVVASIGATVKIYRQWRAFVQGRLPLRIVLYNYGTYRLIHPHPEYFDRHTRRYLPLTRSQIDRVAGTPCPCEEDGLSEAIEGVPAVSDLQQATKDMRDGEAELGNVERPTDG